jgi:hypothetical protein
MEQNTGKVLVVDTEPSAAVAAAIQTAGNLPVLTVVNTGTASGQAVVPTEVAPPPKKNCRHCHGRGYVGKNVNTGEPVPCYCVEKPTAKKERLWNLYLQDKFGRK